MKKSLIAMGAALACLGTAHAESSVQLMGLMAQLKQRRARQAQPVPAAVLAFADLPDDAIIEL